MGLCDIFMANVAVCACVKKLQTFFSFFPFFLVMFSEIIPMKERHLLTKNEASFQTNRWRLCLWSCSVSHFLRVEEVVCQSPSLPDRPLSKVSARPPPSHASSLPRRHPPYPGSLHQTFPPVILLHCFRPWQRVRSESRRRLIWRCSGKWLACPRIGNASTATSAARPMSTWQWALSSVPPALGSCKFPLS